MNIYYCGTSKAASSLFHEIFSDQRLLKCQIDKLPAVNYYDIKDQLDKYNNKFPDNTLVFRITNVLYEKFLNLTSSKDFKGIYVFRDPRDIVISAYYSQKDTHPGGHDNRGYLKSIDKQTGFRFVIDFMDRIGQFDSIKSFVTSNDSRFMYLRTEDMKDSQNLLIQALRFLRYQIDDQIEDYIKTKYSWANMHKNNPGHYNNAVPRRFELEMDQSTLDHYYDMTDDLTTVLGYN